MVLTHLIVMEIEGGFISPGNIEGLRICWNEAIWRGRKRESIDCREDKISELDFGH